MKYRKKPVVVEAVQWNAGETSEKEIRELAQEAEMVSSQAVLWRSEDDIHIRTLHGQVVAKIGDWVIKGPSGDLWPCKPDIFHASYEVVDEDYSIDPDYAESAE